MMEAFKYSVTDPDYYRKRRIHFWVLEHMSPAQMIDIAPYASQLGGVEEMLLKFEKYLGECEEERMRA